MNRTAARKEAVQESTMYRQGGGWVVSTWSEARGCHWLSHEMPYSQARQRLADWRRERVEELVRRAAAAELGRAGGKSRSERKTAAARVNGTKGGRPRRIDHGK